MKKFIVKTRALMEQTYNIEAEDKDTAKEIALTNEKDIIDQTQIDSGEVISCGEIE